MKNRVYVRTKVVRESFSLFLELYDCFPHGLNLLLIVHHLRERGEDREGKKRKEKEGNAKRE